MKLLLVDDDPGTLRALKLGLISMGYEISAVETGVEALDMLYKAGGKSGPVRLLVTDFRMPQMDGLELIRKAKQVEKDLKTILMTGYGTERLERQAESLGVSAYLEKPFTPGCLARTIQGVLIGLDMNSEEPRTQWS